MGNALASVVFPVPESSYDVNETNKKWTFRKIPSSRKSHVTWTAVYSCSLDPKCVLVFSHGNQEDMTSNFGMLEYLAARCGCVVIAYEYSGYGTRGVVRQHDRPSEKKIFTDIEDVMMYASSVRPNLPLVLMGRSLGTAPTLHGAAAAFAPKSIAAIVLVSPFTSIVSTRIPRIFARSIFRAFDYFDNVGSAQHVPRDAHMITLHGGALFCVYRVATRRAQAQSFTKAL